MTQLIGLNNSTSRPHSLSAWGSSLSSSAITIAPSTSSCNDESHTKQVHGLAIQATRMMCYADLPFKYSSRDFYPLRPSSIHSGNHVLVPESTGPCGSTKQVRSSNCIAAVEVRSTAQGWVVHT
ncbi:unnamed protein product [Ectocarpus sp. 4 AP-2014]